MKKIGLKFTVEPFRVGDIEFRQSTSLRGEPYFEIVCVRTNPSYMNFEGFEFDPSHGSFRSQGDSVFHKSLSCFTTPETCYTLMYCDQISEEPDWVTVGNRPFEPEINQENLFKVAEYGLKVIHKINELKNEMSWESLEVMEHGLSMEDKEEDKEED